MHNVHDLFAQPHPAVLYPEHQRLELDQPLLDAMLRLFVDRRAPKALRTKIFRAVHAGFAASRAPFTHLGGTLDHGLPLCLWVTAFEVLAHPGGPGDVRPEHVHELLRQVPWPAPALRRKGRSEVPAKGTRKPLPGGTVPVQLYSRLYRARCAFLHGEPDLRAARVHMVDGRRGPLPHQAAVLFRFALLQVLAQHGYHSFPALGRWSPSLPDAQKREYGAAVHRLYDECTVSEALRAPRKR